MRYFSSSIARFEDFQSIIFICCFCLGKISNQKNASIDDKPPKNYHKNHPETKTKHVKWLIVSIKIVHHSSIGKEIKFSGGELYFHKK